jgi:cyclophilin family peptidyl-prolyl cis-trans isomerase
MENKYLAGLVIVIIIVAAAFYFRGPQPTSMETATPAINGEEISDPKTAIAVFDTSYGVFEVSLDGQAAPQTVANFVKLANDGFYDNLTFHRIVAGFMIQGGDPSGDGTGGPGYTIPAEIGLKHEKGAIAMARLSDQVNPDKASSGSQFYITLEPQPFLDGAYTVFGYVTSGLDIVEAIGSVPTELHPFTGEPSVPLEPVIINQITIKQ